ncbi:MAG: hypothetical protein J7K00_00785 [Candidatus Diapherotrites archaeon]|nr:hypothetical protein [Candidatus Diapherotrites archaeon]
MKKLALICSAVVLAAVISGCVFPEAPGEPGKNDHYCETPSDCAEKNLIHPMCVGHWTCVENRCGWECETIPYPLEPPEIEPPEKPPVDLQPLTKETCEGAGGLWNECGSACRGAPPGTDCIMVCVQYCECGGIAGFGCPQGYVCTDFIPEGAADAMGVCRPVIV